MNLHRPLTPLALTFVLARLLAACADSSGGGSLDPLARNDAGADAMCGITGQCPAHNTVCVRGTNDIDGRCVTPPTGGLCTPTGTDTGEVEGCYPGARCLPVPMTQSRLGGMCLFAGAPGEVFRVQGVEKIALIEPTPFNEYQPQQALTLRWTPPSRQTVDTAAVTVLMRRPPVRDAGSNRLRNPEDIVWIWSSTDPGGAVAGAVSLRAGRTGLRADGTLGPAYARDTLSPGRYWWMTYTLQSGTVRAASDAFTFRVGDDFAEQSCNGVSACVALIPGETADRVACVFGACKRRCASDLDCPGVGRRCALDASVTDPGGQWSLPRGAYCANRM